MRVFILWCISKIRPGKKISDSISLYSIFEEAVRVLVGYMRGIGYRALGVKGSVGIFGCGVKASFKTGIRLGRHVLIGDYVRISGLGLEGMAIGDYSSIGAFSRIIVSTNHENPGLYIKIGKNVGMAEYCSLGGSGGLEIGDNTIIAQYFSAHPENHNFSSKGFPIKYQGSTPGPITIGRGCWIGAKVTVLAGVSIGDNCVIGAGSVVTKSIPCNSLAFGNPAKIVRSI